MNPKKKIFISMTFMAFAWNYGQETVLTDEVAQDLAEGKKTVAILDFEGRGISVMEAATLTDRLMSEMVNTDAIIMVERNQMDEILQEQGFQQSGCTTNECAIEIGQLMNVEKIIGGSVNKVGNTFSSSIRMINIFNGNIEKIISFDYSGPIDEMLKRGMKKIAIELTL